MKVCFTFLLLKVPVRLAQSLEKTAFNFACCGSPLQRPFFLLHLALSFVPLRAAFRLPGTGGQPLRIETASSPPTASVSGTAVPPGTRGLAPPSTRKLPAGQASGFGAFAARAGASARSPSSPKHTPIFSASRSITQPPTGEILNRAEPKRDPLKGGWRPARDSVDDRAPHAPPAWLRYGASRARFASAAASSSRSP